MTSEIRTCQNCKQNFTIASEDFAFYKKIDVPAPTFCPDCRLQRRYAWRNLRSLYRRPCGLCKKDVVGIFAPGKPYNAFCSSCWWGDGWDGLTYGRDYDFSKPFFVQLDELLKAVPLLGRAVYEDTMVNSDFTHMAHHLKNCYLVFHGINCERCMYCVHINDSYDCFDNSLMIKCEQCYESINLTNCHTVHFSQDSEQCHDSFFLRNCSDCHDCFGCVNLRHKSYHIFNTPYSKDDYVAKLKEMGVGSGKFSNLKKLKEQAHAFHTKFPVRYMRGTHNENVSGDYISNCKNVEHSFLVLDVEDSKYCTNIYAPGVKDCYDWTQYGDGGELVYEMLQSGEKVYRNRFGWCIWRGTQDIEYGVLNVGADHCFGCVGLKKKQFCILNKEYSEQEYYALREKIIQHMSDMPYIDKGGRTYKYGEFFPIDLSPFAYNESTAIDEFPLSEAETLAAGFSWIDVRALRGTYTQTMDAVNLSDSILQTDESILKEVIGCNGCGKAYRILLLEFEFYKKMTLPLPRLCPDCRYTARMQMKNPMRLWSRPCQCAGVFADHGGYKNISAHFHGATACPNKFATSFAPERPEIVYCDACYQEEIV